MQLNNKDISATFPTRQDKQAKLVRRDVHPGSLDDHHKRMFVVRRLKVHLATVTTTSNSVKQSVMISHSCEWNQYHSGTTLLSPGMQLERFIGALASPLVM
jgi:hypothetical protein